MSSLARLELIESLSVTVVFCTPSYALHLGQVADQNDIDLRASSVRAIVVAGEPGGSIPAFREQIELMWDATVIDHCGASEIGPWGFADADRRGILVNESEFVCEFLPLDENRTDNSADPLFELVLTNLGRYGCPIIRYRTGDLVRPVFDHLDESNFVLLDGGVLGRVDDMMIIRGVNIYPSSIEQILRQFNEVNEYRMTATKRGSLDELTIEVEDTLNEPRRIAEQLQVRLGLNVLVTIVPAGTLPRFEAKGKRFVDQR